LTCPIPGLHFGDAHRSRQILESLLGEEPGF
jgi:hypothetical protein